MTAVGYGPLWRIDGPPPQAPSYTLLGASRIVPEAEERFGNGVSVYPYPVDLPEVHDACSSGSDRIKSEGGVVPRPDFGAMTVYLAETCSALGIFGAGLSNEEAQARFVARANAAYGATESAAIEREFLAGDVLGTQPFLADGNGTFPTANVAQKVSEGVALLELEIAASGKRGLIHASPGVTTIAANGRLLDKATDGTLKTINGTVWVPGYGYADTTVHPAGHPAAGSKQEWIYATGPVEVRRSDLFLIPGELSQALDRSQNVVTYRAERVYVVDWDTAVQSAVLVDRSTP